MQAHIHTHKSRSHKTTPYSGQTQLAHSAKYLKQHPQWWTWRQSDVESVTLADHWHQDSRHIPAGMVRLSAAASAGTIRVCCHCESFQCHVTRYSIVVWEGWGLGSVVGTRVYTTHTKSLSFTTSQSHASLTDKHSGRLQPFFLTPPPPPPHTHTHRSPRSFINQGAELN